MEEFSTNVSVEDICFIDHDALRTVIEKNIVRFQMISQNPIWSGNGEEFDDLLDFLVIWFLFP